MSGLSRYRNLINLLNRGSDDMLMKNYLYLLIIAFGLGGSNVGLSKDLSSCRAYLHNGTLTIENGKIFQHFRWNNGNLNRIGFGLQKPENGEWKQETGDRSPSSGLPSPNNGQLLISEEKATPVTEAYLKVSVVYTIGKLNIRKVFRIFPQCPAMACDYILKAQWKMEPMI